MLRTWSRYLRTGLERLCIGRHLQLFLLVRFIRRAGKGPILIKILDGTVMWTDVVSCFFSAPFYCICSCHNQLERYPVDYRCTWNNACGVLWALLSLKSTTDFWQSRLTQLTIGFYEKIVTDQHHGQTSGTTDMDMQHAGIVKIDIKTPQQGSDGGLKWWQLDTTELCAQLQWMISFTKKKKTFF